MPRKPNFLEIAVERNDAEDTCQTNLHCSRNHSGEIVNIDSEGPKTVLSVSCAKHGFLTSFLNKFALGEFVRFLANKILPAKGHKLIAKGAAAIFGHDESLPESVN